MLIRTQNKAKRFLKKPITILTYTIITFSSLHAASVLKNDPVNVTTHYLDPSIWNIIVNENDCFKAAPQSLLQVEPFTSDKGFRQYKVTHISDNKRQRELYSQSLDEQIQQRKILGREFCGGIVSISIMDLPFSKQNSTLNVNDGLLLTDSIRHGCVEIQSQLNQMTQLALQAASGTYSSTELNNLNTVFQAHLNHVEHIAQTKKFNGIPLFNGTASSFDIPINGPQSVLHIPLANFTIDSAGSHIRDLNLTSNSNAQNSLISLSSTSVVATELAAIEAARVNLAEIAKLETDTTMIDVRTDDFSVQHETATFASKAHKIHS